MAGLLEFIGRVVLAVVDGLLGGDSRHGEADWSRSWTYPHNR